MFTIQWQLALLILVILPIFLFIVLLCRRRMVRTSKQVKVKGLLPQKLIITFSRKMMEYQRYIRNRQIERAKNLLKNIDPETYKKGPKMTYSFFRTFENRIAA